jgi:XTP/dITP diphosphohydrolase
VSRIELLLATRSAHKLEEIRRILAPVPNLRLLDLDAAGIPYDPGEEEIEIFETFEENARAKAAYFAERSGLPTVADDSGLEVDALGGAPGVHSKRFAPRQAADETSAERDRANNEHLLRLLGALEIARRTARYVCVAALHPPDGKVLLFRGEAPGLILGNGRGKGGFGYDPLFFDQTLGLTFAQISPRQKNERSHRGKAFRALANHLSYEVDSGR